MMFCSTKDASEGHPRRSSPPAGCRARGRLLVLALWTNGLLPALGQTGLPALAPLTDAATGPTLRLDFGRDPSPANPVASFMYFVPLISPEPVSSITSPGSTQVARVLSNKRKSNAHSFVVRCEFEFTGEGSQRSIFDLEPKMRRHQQQLKAGGSMDRQLSSITVQGPGSGTVEVEGSISNHVETVSAVRLRFNSRGKASPVAIELCELRYAGGEFRRLNEIVAPGEYAEFSPQAGPAQNGSDGRVSEEQRSRKRTVAEPQGEHQGPGGESLD